MERCIINKNEIVLLIPAFLLSHYIVNSQNLPAKQALARGWNRSRQVKYCPFVFGVGDLASLLLNLFCSCTNRIWKWPTGLFGQTSMIQLNPFITSPP